MQGGQGGNRGRSPANHGGLVALVVRLQTRVQQRVHDADHVGVIAQHPLAARVHRVHRTGHAGSLAQLIAVLNDRGLQRHGHRQARNIRGFLGASRVTHAAHNRRQVIGQGIAAIVLEVRLAQVRVRGPMQRGRERMGNRVAQHVGAAKIRGFAVRFSLHRYSFALNAGSRTATGATSHFSGYARGRAPPHSRGNGARPLHQLQLSYSGPGASSTTGCTLPRNAGAQRKCGSTWSRRNPGRRSPSSSTGSSPERRRP